MAAIIAIGQTKEKPGQPTMTLPVDAVSQDGVAPEKGDQIEHSVKGTVTKVVGDTVTIKVTAIDGSPVEGSAAEEASESPKEESAEEQEGPSGASPNPAPAAFVRPPSNPLAAALAPARARTRAQTAAIGAALRRRARGAPIPLM